MMPWPCLADYVNWPMVIAVVVALLLTALMLCCIWVAADADKRAIDQNGDGDKHEQTNNQAG